MKFFEKEIKQLGFGLMRLPLVEGTGKIDIEQTKKMVDRFMESGFTYFDTAYVYGEDGASEKAAREALVERYPRDSFWLATKINCRVAGSAEEARQQLYTSLERTGAGYFDFYLLHDLERDNEGRYEEWGLWDFVREMKEKGLVRHYGFSFHSSPEHLEELLTKHPDVEFVQLQINYADWEDVRVASRACYEVARKHNKPVVVMEPVKGGMLAEPPETVKKILKDADPEASCASWAIRFVASLPGIFTVLSGMSSVEQMEDNLSYMKDFRPLTEEEKETIRNAREALSKIDSIPCTGCRYCVPGCPMQINIPGCLRAYNAHMVYENMAQAKRIYGMNTPPKAGECIGCGQCEAACPQHLEIIGWLRKVSELLDA